MLRLAWLAGRQVCSALVALPRDAADALTGVDRADGAQRLLFALTVVVPLALLARWAVSQVIIVMSPSIEAWAVRPDPGPIRKNDYVMFELSHPLAGPRPVNITKHALCLPGDQLVMIERPSLRGPDLRDGSYYCNGQLLGVSKPYGRNNQRLAHFQWPGGIIPTGFVYIGSGNPDGFDSRYFGLVRLDRLIRMRRVL